MVLIDFEFVVVIFVVDCLFVLFVVFGGVVGVYVGWCGLVVGVLENIVVVFCVVVGCELYDVKVWLGVCIGFEVFEVGLEVV